MALTDSNGLKRRIAAALSVLLGVAQMIPGSEGVVTAIQWLAGFFGVTGLIHAGATGTTNKEVLAGLASITSTVILLAYFVPQLQPLIPVLQKASLIFGSAAMGAGVAKVVTK